MFKKCMSIALVLVMVFGVLTIMPFPVSATIDSGSSVIVENVSEVSDYYGTPETIDELSTQEAIEDTTTNLKGNDDLSPVGSSFTTDDGFTYTTNGNCATITKYAGTANELVIPDTIDGYTVTEISSNAFYNRSALVSVIIPDSVTNIGSEAFYGCTGLTSVSISKNLVTIETGLFRGCTALKSVVIPNKVTTIKNRAFQGCKGLESVTIPSSVISIGYEAFYNCSGLTKINIPNSVTTMDSEVFFGCSGLTSLTFPNNITSIESALCKGCTGLTSITIPNTVTYIGSEAFRGCSSLINLTIPASVTDIISNAFRGCSGLSSISVSSGNPIYDSRNNCNAIIESKSKEIILGCKNTIIPNGIFRIGDAAFYECSGLSSISIPESVTQIGDQAFCGCVELDSISIPDSVDRIGSGSFAGTAWYNNQPNGVVYAGRNLYKFKGSITSNSSLILSQGTKSITDYAFENCTGLASITIPDSLTHIGYCAFLNCTDLTDITISDSVTSIGNSAFANTAWYNAQSEGLVYIGKVAYTYKGIMPTGTELKIKSGTKGVANSAFYLCSGMKSVDIPDSVTNIGDGAFNYCSGLDSIRIPDSVTTLGNGAFSNTGINNLSIGSGVVNIGNYAFHNTDLTSVTITSNVEKIGERAFGYYSGKDSIYHKVQDFVIYGETGSTAEAYAIDNEFAFVNIGQQDTQNPTVSLSSTNNVASSQTVTISLSDNVGIRGYYWGTSSSYSNNSYTSTSNTSVSKTVDASGTYYATAVDTSGNVSSNVSITFYKTTLNANATNASVSPTSVLTKSGNSFTFPTPTRSGYTYVGWSTSSSASSGVKTLSPSSNSTYYAVWSYTDTQKPTVSLSSTNNVASSQTVTISLSDNVGIRGYYWGTSSTYSNNSYTSTSNTSISKTVDASGTYYATAVDTSGNVSSNISITFYKTTLNANGGSVSPTSVLTKSGNSFILPVPTHSNTNYTYVGWSNYSSDSSGVKSLVPSSNMTFYAIWKTKISFAWGVDNWKFNNNTPRNYNVNNTVKKQLANDFRLSNKDLRELETEIYEDNLLGYGGSCFGFTVSEIMVKQGDLKLSRYGGNDIIHQNNATDNMISVINFLQEMQGVSSCSQILRQAPFTQSSVYSQENYIEKMESVLTSSDKLIKVGIRIKWRNKSTGKENYSGHALLAYGVESCNYKSAITGKTYDKRILIADPNFLDYDNLYSDSCIYYRSSDKSWICPEYCFSTTSKTYKCYWNASYGGKDISSGFIGNIMQYLSPTESVNLMSDDDVSHYISGISLNNRSGNSIAINQVEDTGNPNMDYMGSAAGGTGIAKYDIESDNIFISDSNDFYALWNPTASYESSFEKPSSYKLKMDYEDIVYYVDTNNGTYQAFKPSGYLQFRGSDASYTISMVTNNNECCTDWYDIAITGSETDTMSLKKISSGYVLTSNNLSNVSIKACNDEMVATRSFSTTYESVFIYEIDETHIGLMIDTDKNGTYETELPVENPVDPDKLILGDVDGDGTIMITDATFIQRKIAQIEIPFDFRKDIADTDGDGEVTLMDVTYIQRWLSNLKSNDNIGKPIVGG